MWRQHVDRYGLALAGLALTTACGAEDPDPVSYTTSGPFEPPGAGDTEGDADDGLDDSGGEEPGLAPGACLLDPAEGLTGTKYQCGGALSLTFEADGFDPIEYDVFFGPNNLGPAMDSYEEPYVMACCADFVPPDLVCGSMHTWACYQDMLQQMCVGLAVRVAEGIESGEIPNIPATTELRDWLATHTQQCFVHFRDQVGLDDEQTSCPSPDWEDRMSGVQWHINETFGLLIEDPVMTIQSGVIENVVDGDEAECAGWNENDRHVPLALELPPTGSTHLTLEGGQVSGDGPGLGGQAMSAETVLGGTVLGCTDRCSQAELSVPNKAGRWSLHRMDLRSAQPSEVDVGGGVVEIESFEIELYRKVDAKAADPSHLVIPTGGATFLLAADTSAGVMTLPAANGSPIILDATGEGYALSPFNIVVSPQTEDPTTFTVHSSHWVASTEQP